MATPHGVGVLPRWFSGKESACTARDTETQFQSLGQEDPLEKEMATHSSILARIPRTEEPGGLLSMGSQSPEGHRISPPGIKVTPPSVEVQSLNQWTTLEVSLLLYFFFKTTKYGQWELTFLQKNT